MPLGGSVIGQPLLAHHFDGRLQVFVVGNDGAIWTFAQPSVRVVTRRPFGPLTRMSTGFDNVFYHEEVIFDPLTTRLQCNTSKR
jgi:hypothetical protein